jgi:hypothetical protein
MKSLIRLEELSFGILAFAVFVSLGFAWWLFLVLLLLPDLSMIGYGISPRIGAILYNIVHHRALSVALFVAGSLLATPWMQAAALVLFGHSSFDRALGYGLKYEDSFQHTHLGMIGEAARNAPNEKA